MFATSPKYARLAECAVCKHIACSKDWAVVKSFSAGTWRFLIFLKYLNNCSYYNYNYTSCADGFER